MSDPASAAQVAADEPVAEVEVDEPADVAAAPQLGTRVYRIRPGELVWRLNVRTEVDDDPQFAASIRELGVLQPIVAYVNTEARLQVLMGQRRAYFAHQQGLPWVPVVLVAPPFDVDRLVDQLVENHHRAPITLADQAAAVLQLTLHGVTVDEIARRTSRRRVDVNAVLAVAASPAATAAAAVAPVDLEQAAAIAEVDNDPAAVEQLTAAARQGRGAFEHQLQRVRDERRDREDKARVLAEIRAAGVTAIDRLDWSAGVRPLDGLGISPSKHRRCPGHAAYPTGTQRNVDGHWSMEWGIGYVCTQPKLHRKTTDGEVTLDDEAARAARAEVIEGNKQWRAAEQVRRRWLREFARRQRAPLAADAFIAQALLRADECIRRALDNRHVLLRELLAPEEQPVTAADELDQLVARVEDMPQRLVRVLTVATLLAAWEATTDVHCWRDRHDGSALMNRVGGHRGVDTFYMGWFRRFGYEPSEIEQRLLVADGPKEGAHGGD